MNILRILALHLKQRIEEFEVLRDIRIAERQLAEGGGIPHEEAKARVLARLRTRLGRV